MRRDAVGYNKLTNKQRGNKMIVYAIGNGIFERYIDKKTYTASQIQTLRKAGFNIKVLWD